MGMYLWYKERSPAFWNHFILSVLGLLGESASETACLWFHYQFSDKTWSTKHKSYLKIWWDKNLGHMTNSQSYLCASVLPHATHEHAQYINLESTNIRKAANHTTEPPNTASLKWHKVRTCGAASHVLVTSLSWVRALTAARRCCTSVNDNPTLSQG